MVHSIHHSILIQQALVLLLTQQVISCKLPIQILQASFPIKVQAGPWNHVRGHVVVEERLKRDEK